MHGIVRRHEGAVSVQSNVGKGTTFQYLYSRNKTGR
ncbi:MAG: hypothetical protein ACLQVJ_09505 [Syntrophobacteraceae bacterium]